ncbi:MAG: hypothetical protein IZT58_14210 [Actinobacteria bacterium]|nr:hypothetical protein [Actinomycetota bacterium]
MLAVGDCLGDREDVLADALAADLFSEELGDAFMREREHVLDGQLELALLQEPGQLVLHYGVVREAVVRSE